MSALTGCKVAIMGDCATQHIAIALRGWGYEAGIRYEVLDTDYNQIDAQTMDPGSELYTVAPNYCILANCTDKLYESFCAFPPEARKEFAETIRDRMVAVWQRINANMGTRILQFNFPAWDDRVFGDFGSKTPDSFSFQLRKLNHLLAESCAEYKNVFLVDIDGLQSRLGEAAVRDAKMYCIAKMPFRTDILPHIAKQITDTVLAASGSFKKCIVLDLDNTLWGGVVGDDGIDGIQIGELGLGHAFSAFQLWLKELKNRGIILCVCSKNNESAAKEPFLHHPEMVLKLEDISVFVANWEDKASNIRHIQSVLNIGMDSLVFLDDNPFERSVVRNLIPNITVPELPENPEEYVDYLRSLNLFETVSFSEEDRVRTQQYRAEAQRVSLQSQCTDYDAYLQGLEMIAEAKPFDSFHFPRIAQLTQRSNQFNLRTVRYTEQEIAAIAADPNYVTIYFTLRDKFGDHGLISAVIMQKLSDRLFVDTWLMSCRVLKRGMEEFIINKMLSVAAEHGFDTVEGEYLKTAKNAMVANIYEKLGFSPMGDGRFVVHTANFTPNKTHISEE
ncbi:MAG: HAD family hydrolase [Clostridia bacterium]|nr:HAD family hydrolase [Clostridia bacterium]